MQGGERTVLHKLLQRRIQAGRNPLTGDPAPARPAPVPRSSAVIDTLMQEARAAARPQPAPRLDLSAAVVALAHRMTLPDNVSILCDIEERGPLVAASEDAVAAVLDEVTAAFLADAGGEDEDLRVTMWAGSEHDEGRIEVSAPCRLSLATLAALRAGRPAVERVGGSLTVLPAGPALTGFSLALPLR